MAASLLTSDTSVIVPSLLQWHELHRRAAGALREVRVVPARALTESFSVLTRLPARLALPPRLAEQVLAGAFPEQPRCLSAQGYLAVLRRLAEAGLGSGAIYDAVVGATAAEAGARLLTADRRALATYTVVGADVEFID